MKFYITTDKIYLPIKYLIQCSKYFKVHLVLKGAKVVGGTERGEAR